MLTCVWCLSDISLTSIEFRTGASQAENSADTMNTGQNQMNWKVDGYDNLNLKELLILKVHFMC